MKIEKLNHLYSRVYKNVENMLKRKKLNNKANLKHDEEIEILDFEEKNTTPKLRLKLPKIKVKNKQNFRFEQLQF